MVLSLPQHTRHDSVLAYFSKIYPVIGILLLQIWEDLKKVE
jgi:hypothetical protein